MQVQRQNLNARLPILEKTAAAAEQSGKKDARKRHGALNLILETGHFKTMRPLAAAARVSPPSCLALFEQKWDGGQCRDGIEPCDMKDGVERKSNQGNKCQIRTCSGLRRIRCQGRVVSSPCFPALQSSQDWHCEEGGDGDTDSCPTGLRS